MYSRRFFCGCAALGALAAAASSAVAQQACEVFTPARQNETAPEAALQRLFDGNARFVAGRSVNCDLMAQVKATAAGQAPFAAVVGCIDSRVPPELVLDQRIGDVFTARIAGNFVNTDIIGSLEFSTKLSGAKAIMILGHTDCGAIKGAVDDVRLGNLTTMLKHFAPALRAGMAKTPGERSSKNKYLVQSVADINAVLAAKTLTEKSPVLKKLVDSKQLVIAAAMHDLDTGKITRLS